MISNLKSLGLVGIIALSACNSVRGTIEVYKSFTYTNKSSSEMISFCRSHPTDYYCKGVDTDNETVTVVPGSYGATLELASASQAFLTIDYKTKSGDKTKLSFKMPNGQAFPRYQGDVSLSSAQTGQAYDMRGRVETEESDSSPTQSTESCTYTVQERVCRYENVTDRQGRTHREHRCCMEPVTYPGRQDVEYYYHTTTTDFNVGLYAPSSSDLLAAFKGRSTSHDKVYTYQGICR